MRHLRTLWAAALLAGGSPAWSHPAAPPSVGQEIVFRGRPGADGRDGHRGLSGLPGCMGSLDARHPRAGGRGGPGGRGENGGSGGRGGDGPALAVTVTLERATPPLLRIQVRGAGELRDTTLAPDQGVLTLRSLGGPGGRGGRGGDGGRGGSGGIGRPDGSRGASGSPGSNGASGSPGRGGAITVTVDPKAAPYLGSLRFDSPGGPPPEIRVAAP